VNYDDAQRLVILDAQIAALHELHRRMTAAGERPVMTLATMVCELSRESAPLRAQRDREVLAQLSAEYPEVDAPAMLH